MIEIRPAKTEELARERALWKLAFGDSDAYIGYFYDHPAAENTLVLLEDGVLQTMVALFPVEVVLPDGVRLKSAYIYALATHPDARKKGFGRFILNYVDFYLKERGVSCVTIVPAEAGLHRFFATQGFLECFTTRKAEVLGYTVDKPTDGDVIESVDPASYRAIRERILKDSFYVSYDEPVLTYQQGLSQMANGGLYRLVAGGVEGCAVAEYTDNDETVGVKELLLPKEMLSVGVGLLARQLTAMRYHVRTPGIWDGLVGSYPQPFAMIKWYDSELERVWRDQSKGYMGLGFD